ncbi:MAG TPA: type II secretion system protein [Burkholderiales bacterium]|nr:type II secretion system protein [Burkholderiales bacterium]
MVKRERGFTYITVLFVVAMMSGGLALIGEVWHTANVREKEAELLHIGNEYRKAIERYYLSGPVRQYPKSLADLVKDPRHPGTVRHLRRLYPDPITGKDDWGLVKSADGGFAGVYSPSEDAPLKTGGFGVRDAALEGKTKYSEWQFVFAPAQAAAKPGAVAAKPGAVTPESKAPPPRK